MMPDGALCATRSKTCMHAAMHWTISLFGKPLLVDTAAPHGLNFRDEVGKPFLDLAFLRHVASLHLANLALLDRRFDPYPAEVGFHIGNRCQSWHSSIILSASSLI